MVGWVEVEHVSHRGPEHARDPRLFHGLLGGQDGASAQTAAPLLEIDGLSMHFTQKRGILRRQATSIRAVNGLSLSIFPGETLGLVGESGCGKTTTGRCIIRTLDPTAGAIRFRQDDGSMLEVGQHPKSSLKPYRRQVRMIFQDPYSSLDPRMTVADIVGESLRVNGLAKGSELQDRVVVRHFFLAGVAEVREQREMEIFFAIGEEAHFECVDERIGFRGVA